MTGIITAIATGTLVLFVAATIIAGAAQGIAISAATRGLLHGSTSTDRAPTFSVIYLISYSGATIPALIAGQLTNTFSLPQIALGYGALALVATVYTVAWPQPIQRGPDRFPTAKPAPNTSNPAAELSDRPNHAHLRRAPEARATSPKSGRSLLGQTGRHMK
ncbi:hypothetical protein [Arthrobacter sp. OAP107]|uniref:hypothetical protein n=1 Tax=Arthrobacter sp. OAP107 TaxID=3156445 RepID=UPI00339A70F0